MRRKNSHLRTPKKMMNPKNCLLRMKNPTNCLLRKKNPKNCHLQMFVIQSLQCLMDLYLYESWPCLHWEDVREVELLRLTNQHGCENMSSRRTDKNHRQSLTLPSQDHIFASRARNIVCFGQVGQEEQQDIRKLHCRSLL